MENENEGKKRTNLRWQHDFLPLDDFSDVQIKKVAVQNGLNNSGNDSDPVGVVFEVVSVDPVGNVQSPVRTLGE